MSSAHIRHGAGAVRPYVYGPMSLLAFLERAFNATVVERHDFSESSAHCELKIGDSVLILEAGELPPDVKPWTCSIYIYVADVEAVFKDATEEGFSVVAEPTDKPYQERQAAFRDSVGNTWWISTFTG